MIELRIKGLLIQHGDVVNAGKISPLSMCFLRFIYQLQVTKLSCSGNKAGLCWSYSCLPTYIILGAPIDNKLTKQQEVKQNTSELKLKVLFSCSRNDHRKQSSNCLIFSWPLPTLPTLWYFGVPPVAKTGGRFIQMKQIAFWLKCGCRHCAESKYLRKMFLAHWWLNICCKQAAIME